MSTNREQELTNSFSSHLSLDDIFHVPGGQNLKEQRTEDSEIFFNSGNSSSSHFIAPKQIRIQKAKPISRAEQENLITNRKLYELYSFFDTNPFISLSNFQTAQKLLANYFDDPTKFIDRILKLKELLPQGFEQHHRFGLLTLDCSYRGNYIKLSIQRSKLKDTEQHISINLENHKPDNLLVFTQWNWKNKKYQIIRSTDIRNRRMGSSPSSIEFDAKVWQAYNSGGIFRKNFLKTLDCVERNYKNLGAFINSVNQKSILNIFDKALINNASIKTDKELASTMNFRTNTSQKVDILVSQYTTSLTVEHC